MARTDTLPHFLTDVADAIRTAEGSSGAITASAFDTRIEALSGGGGANLNDYFASTPSIDAYNALSIMKQFPTIDCSERDNLDYFFDGCYIIETLPTLINTSGIVECMVFAGQCMALVNVPYYTLPNCTSFSGAFSDSSLLSDTSIQNIMQMCIDCDNENYAGERALEDIIHPDLLYKAENMSNYQDFLNAGWTVYYGE